MEYINEKSEKYHPGRAVDARWAADALDVAALRRNHVCPTRAKRREVRESATAGE